MEPIIRYQIWNGYEHGDLYQDLDDAINDARWEGADEVEMLVWYSERNYQNYEPADEFKIVWRRN